MNNKSIVLLIIGLITITFCDAQTSDRIVINDDIQLVHLQDSVFLHITFDELENFGRFSSNGLVIIRNGHALLIDSPMDNEKTQKLTTYIQDSFSAKVEKLIACHFHDDCLGGLSYLHRIGVESIANSMTIGKCKELGIEEPLTAFTDSLIFDFYGEPIECRYFGAGHSFDNITVCLPSEKILFGGCLVKSANSRNLGNLGDAIVEDWDTTAQQVKTKYADAKVIVPGHGALGGSELLTHTIDLVAIEKNK
ncbi:subclass B1 metallo-beta-lactamase [Draconibacterium sediminis]|uniref:beta-lactamase n=1 Tax=Draconibacterium sediminis TaxID=1544798 RepID=A0A0D8JDA0_9BACT|nr:subclass B1 metallo-beta-lactamase [Draconibacterium sediminis]KJF44925.1 Zn-dependent hydrolase [Draconibacterium sediminis]